MSGKLLGTTNSYGEIEIRDNDKITELKIQSIIGRPVKVQIRNSDYNMIFVAIYDDEAIDCAILNFVDTFEIRRKKLVSVINRPGSDIDFQNYTLNKYDSIAERRSF